MKLQELAVLPQSKQVAKVFESYFGKSITFESISKSQAHAMLGRVRGLLGEHRRTPAFHKSEQDSAYLKLVMLEQVLTKKIKEEKWIYNIILFYYYMLPTEKNSFNLLFLLASYCV